MTRSWTCVCVALLLVTAGCNAPRTGAEIGTLLSQTMDSVRLRLDQGESVEAYQLASAVAEVDPDYPDLDQVWAQLPDMDNVLDRDLLGSNLAMRTYVDSPWWVRALLFLPDRVLDTMDLVSFDVHLGFGVYADVHMTRAVQVAAGFRSVGGLGWHDHRSFGVLARAEAGLSLPGVGAEANYGMLAGTSGVRGGTWSQAGFHRSSNEIYREFRDYWAVGASLTAGIAGIDFDLHPVEMYDFVAGLLTFDPLNDDFATSRGLDLTQTEWRFVRTLSEIAGSDDELENYLLWRDGTPDDSAALVDASP